MLRVGAWCVNPASGEISRNGETARLEARTMRLLLCLAERPGDVVSIDDLLKQVWPGVIVSPDSVYQAVASLRRLLGDDPKQPTYVATVPRLGYRMVAAVSPWVDQSTALPASVRATPGGRLRTWFPLAAGAVICLALVSVADRRRMGVSPVADPTVTWPAAPAVQISQITVPTATA